MKVRVALIQMDCSASREVNLANAEKNVRLAASQQGAQVILLPEVFHELFFMTEFDMKHFDAANRSRARSQRRCSFLQKNWKW